jgi:hypothetical protein
VTSIVRIATAFAVSPAASTVTMVAILSIIGRAIPSAGYIFTVAALVYGTAIVLGIPAFLLSRGWHLHSVAFYAGASLVVAAPPTIVAAMLTREVVLPLVAAVGAVAGGVVFHKITERRPETDGPGSGQS